MSFDIEARIENGAPALRILDADSRTVRLCWACPQGNASHQGTEARALQLLFRELFLLSLLPKLAPGQKETHPDALFNSASRYNR